MDASATSADTALSMVRMSDTTSSSSRCKVRYRQHTCTDTTPGVCMVDFQVVILAVHRPSTHTAHFPPQIYPYAVLMRVFATNLTLSTPRKLDTPTYPLTSIKHDSFSMDAVSRIHEQLDQLEATRTHSQDSKQQRFRTFPITECATLAPKLRAMGLKLSANDIDGTSLGRGTRHDDHK